MAVKPGDRIDCRIKESSIVGAYGSYDEIKTFEVIAIDNQGCFVYVPHYLTIKDSVELDKYLCNTLTADSKFIGEQVCYISNGMISRISQASDGCKCSHCKEFFSYASSNQDGGGFLCFSCRENPWR